MIAMLRLEDVSAVIDSLLSQGTDDYDRIVDAVFARFAADVDAETAVRNLIRRRVSLAVSQLRDDSGERLAFPDRTPEGAHRIVHLGYTHDAEALVRISKRYDRI